MTDQHLLLRSATVSAASDLAALWAALMGEGGFDRRTLWLVLLDRGGHPAPVVVPLDDIPAEPGPRDVAGLGTVLTGVADLGTPVLLLSRPGPPEVQDSDRRWAAALGPLAPAWPVHLATADPAGGSRSCLVRALDAR
jgi:hypothetical protein